MFKKLFNKKEQESLSPLVVYSPGDGEIVPLEEVSDPVFSEKMMGDGCALIPASGEVVSPVKGVISQVFPTKHAIGIKTDVGAEILLHVGLDTVNLKGEGFEVFIKEGDSVEVGDKILEFDKAVIEEKATSSVIPIIITNTDKMTSIKMSKQGTVSAGKDEILVIEP